MSKLSNQQRDQFRQAFQLLDVDSDGKVTTVELKNILAKIGSDVDEDQLQEMIRVVDQDKNGTIELQEFLTFMEKNLNIANDQGTQLKEIFKMFDLDGNGLITKQQLRAGLGKLGQRLSEKQIEALMEQADIDGDGNINYEQFVELMNKK